MGRKVLMIAVALVLGGSPAAAAPAPRDAHTHAQMRAVLLAPEAMPAGWTLGEEGDDAWGDLFMPYAPCDHVPREPDYKPLPVSVYVTFAGGHDRKVLESVGASGSRLAHEMITSLGDLADNCPVRRAFGVTTTASRLPIPVAGDASIAVLFTIETRTGDTVSTEQLVVGIIAHRDVCAVIHYSAPDQLSLAEARTVLSGAARELQRIE